MSTAFDTVAEGYDAAFTDTRLGRWLRWLVRERVAGLLAPGARVLELGCGTGEDAVWLARRGLVVTATDAAPEMLAVARRKAVAAGVAERVAFQTLDLAYLEASGPASPDRPGQYDLVFSNFGALNCLADRRPLAAWLAGRVRPGGAAALVLMGPLCPWEIAWHMARGDVRAALRRLRAGEAAPVGAGAVRVWYPTPGRLRDEMAPWFRLVGLAGVGALLPPPFLERLAGRAPRLFEALALVERRCAQAWPWPWLSDHYLAIFERSA